VEAQQIIDLIKETGGEAVLESTHEVRNPYVILDPERLVEICTFCRDDQRLQFDFLMNLTGVDYEDKQTVVYHLYSYPLGHHLEIKVDTPREDPQVPSVGDVWKAALLSEREAWDLLGIRFLNHPDLRRVLLTDDWEGFPLRKDYKEPAEIHGISTTRDNPLDILKKV